MELMNIVIAVLKNNAFQLYSNWFSNEHFVKEVKAKIVAPFLLTNDNCHGQYITSINSKINKYN